MLSPDTENTLGYWRVLYEKKNINLNRTGFREIDLNYLKRKRELRKIEMGKLEREKLELERIIKGKLKRDRIDRERN